MSLAYTPGPESAVDADAAHLGLGHRQRLGRQHVAHLGGADAEGDGAEGAVSGGMRVAAGDGHARLGEPQLRPDDVDDPLIFRIQPEEGDAVLGDVALQRLVHLLGERIAQRPHLAIGGHDVVHRGEGALGIQHRQAAFLQHLERLRRSHLVDQVQTDEQLGLAGFQGTDGVQIPDLVEQRSLRHGCLKVSQRRVGDNLSRIQRPADEPLLKGHHLERSLPGAGYFAFTVGFGCPWDNTAIACR